MKVSVYEDIRDQFERVIFRTKSTKKKEYQKNKVSKKQFQKKSTKKNKYQKVPSAQGTKKKKRKYVTIYWTWIFTTYQSRTGKTTAISRVVFRETDVSLETLYGWAN